MAQLPVLRGVYTDSNSDIRVSLPRNLEPVPLESGISAGYLRPADGIAQFGTGPGIDRGAINWNGICYRVMGTKLVRVKEDGTYFLIGDVGGSGQVTLDYSFTHLGIASGGKLFLYDGTTLAQVTDPDLGACIDFRWIDGFFMSTDGEFLVVTELTNPFAVNPLKYASSEADPDPIKCLSRLRNEIYAVNRYTMEVFNNIGGNLFPFQRVEGAQLQRGAIGAHAAVVFLESIAFLGSGRNEALAIWIGANGQSRKLSSREIDLLLREYTEAELEATVLESRLSAGQNLLYVHLPDYTLVYNHDASQQTGELIWYTVDSGLLAPSQYRARNFVRCYDKWLCGDPLSTAHGYLVEHISSHYGDSVGWSFSTQILYNAGKGAIVHSLELVALTGRAVLGANSTIWTQYSLDGITWSVEKGIFAGKVGERLKRLVWLMQGKLSNWRIQRFRGTSDAHVSIARLEAELEPLRW